MSLHDFEENQCVLTAQKPSACMEFMPGGDERHGFQSGQLLHYSLTLGESDSGQPTEALTIAFPTAEVKLTGTGLRRIADHLRDGTLLAVRSLPDRYAHLVRPRTHVIGISITAIEEG